METYERIKQLFERQMEKNAAAVELAINRGLIEAESLDPANPHHRVAVIEYHAEKTVPAKFVRTADLGELGRLINSKNKANREAGWEEIEARLSKGQIKFLTDIIQNRALVTPINDTPSWDKRIVDRLVPVLSDVAAVSESEWHSVRRFIDAATEELIVKARANTKRKATIAAVASGQQVRRAKSADPLLCAIEDGQYERMRNIHIEEIKRERWEEVREAWLACTEDKIKVHLIRLPFEFIEPHLLIALEAEAVVGPTYYSKCQKRWAVPKKILKELSPSALVYHLKAACNGTGKVDAPITGQDLVSDLAPMLVMEALHNPEVTSVTHWLEGLRKARKLLGHKNHPTAPTEQEAAMIECVTASLSGGSSGGDSVDYFSKADSDFTDTVKLFLNLDETAQKRLAGTILSSKVSSYKRRTVEEAMSSLFCGHLTNYDTFGADI
jgi:hypothetical protein